MNKVDKRVKKYLERAIEVASEMESWSSELFGKYKTNDIIEIAKMIQVEEHSPSYLSRLVEAQLKIKKLEK